MGEPLFILIGEAGWRAFPARAISSLAVEGEWVVVYLAAAQADGSPHWVRGPRAANEAAAREFIRRWSGGAIALP